MVPCNKFSTAAGVLMSLGGFAAVASARHIKFCFTAGTQEVTAMEMAELTFDALSQTAAAAP